jgi:predicted ABC-type ATPase
MKTDKRLVVVGGPNGSGKSTLAYQYAKEFSLDYLGADDIAAEFAARNGRCTDIEAGKEFFRRLREYAEHGKSLIIESTLSGRSLHSKIGPLKHLGYAIEIIYVFLDSPASCKNRIAIRVRKGGHFVPDIDVERRFHRSIRNFWGLYRPLADRWVLVYNGGVRPVEVAVHDGAESVVLDEGYFSLFRRLEEAT